MKKNETLTKKAAPTAIAVAGGGDSANDEGNIGNVHSRIKLVEEKVQYLFYNARADVYNIRKELVKEIIHTLNTEASELNLPYTTNGKELMNMTQFVEQDRNMLKEVQRELPMLKAKLNELREKIDNFSRSDEADGEKPARKRQK